MMIYYAENSDWKAFPSNGYLRCAWQISKHGMNSNIGSKFCISIIFLWNPVIQITKGFYHVIKGDNIIFEIIWIIKEDYLCYVYNLSWIRK